MFTYYYDSKYLVYPHTYHSQWLTGTLLQCLCCMGGFQSALLTSGVAINNTFHSWFSQNICWEINLGLFFFFQATIPSFLGCCQGAHFLLLQRSTISFEMLWAARNRKSSLQWLIHYKGIYCLITQNKSRGLVNFLAHEVLALFPWPCSQPTSLYWLVPLKIIRCYIAFLHMSVSGCPEAERHCSWPLNNMGLNCVGSFIYGFFPLNMHYLYT